MISYLSNYREKNPEWISKYLRGEQITFKNIMSSRIGYYPGSGHDGTLIKIGNQSHSVHSFLHVDYMLSRKNLEEQIKTIRGYHQIAQIEWKETDLMPNGQYPLDIRTPLPRFKPQHFTNQREPPYCFSVFLERNKNQNDSWGAEHFVVTFLLADGIATYYQLFVKEYFKAPWLFLLQDHGFVGNYDLFRKGGILDEIISKSAIHPEFVICGDNTRIWDNYTKVESVSPIFGGMHHNRRDLYRYSIDK